MTDRERQTARQSQTARQRQTDSNREERYNARKPKKRTENGDQMEGER